MLLPELCYRIVIKKKMIGRLVQAKRGASATAQSARRRGEVHEAGQQRRTTVSVEDQIPSSGRQSLRD